MQEENQKPHLTSESKKFFSWLRKWSSATLPWPYYVGSSCCGAEFLGLYSSEGRRQLNLPIPEQRPQDSDLLILAGSITKKLLPDILDAYDAMLGPKYVVAIGSCTYDGGPFQSYNTISNLEDFIPVDIKIPGCPPTPEQIIAGMQQLREKIING